MATFIVTTNIDESYDNGDLTAETGDGNGLSLREAIGLANANPGADTILFDASVFIGGATSLIRLTLGTELEITDTVTIDGSSATDVLITGDTAGNDLDANGNLAANTTGITDVALSLPEGNTGDGIDEDRDGTVDDDGPDLLVDNTRVFDLPVAGTETTLIDLTITGGRAIGVDENGGGIRAVGDLVLSGVTVAGNSVGGSTVNGGGIFSTNRLTIDDSTISGNRVESGSGGGIRSDSGSLEITGSTISGNGMTGTDFGSGGGIAAQDADVAITDTEISGNFLNGGRGAGVRIVASSDFELSRISVIGNTIHADPDGVGASEGGGLSITQGSNGSISESLIEGNTATSPGTSLVRGGGISITTNAEVAIDGTIIRGNRIATDTPNDDWVGGGITVNSGGSAFVTDSEITGNAAIGAQGGGAGVRSDGFLTLVNTTVAENTTSDGSGGGLSAGSVGTLSLVNVTVTGNSTSGAGAAGGAVHAQTSGVVTVANSILLGNTSNGIAGQEELSDEALLYTTFLGSNIVGADTDSFDATGIDAVENAAPEEVFADLSTARADTTGDGIADTDTGIVSGDPRDNGGAPAGAPGTQEGPETVALLDLASNPAIDAADPTVAIRLGVGPTDELVPLDESVFRIDVNGDGDRSDIFSTVADLETDQRGPGFPRDVDLPAIDGAIDLGAFEFQRADAIDDIFVTDEDTPVSGNVLTNDREGDGDSLTVSLLQDVSGGTLTLGTDGAFTYIPGVNVNGVDMFAYQVSDGDLTDTATVTIAVNPVNDPPVAQDDALATDEDTAISGDLTVDNGNGPDSDADGDTPLVYLVNGQLGAVDSTISLPSGALLTVFADGRYIYHPNGAFDHLALGETAIDSFTYAIFDGNGGVDSATATVTIDGVNDAPDAVDDDFSTGKDSGVFGNVLADNGNGADSDPDGGTSLIVTHVNGSAAAVGSQILLPSGALLMLNADGSFLYGTNGAFEALGDDESFADSFTYTIGDGDGGSDGATATVTIDGGNEAPVAADDALATDEDTAITGNVFSDNGNGPDSDANGDTLTVSAVNGAAAAVGSQIVLASGARLTLNSNGSFVYDPMGAFDDLSPGEADTDGFTYTVTDGKGGSATATVSIGIDGLLDVIRGTPQEDDLTGTDGDDLIYALASDDIIDPRGGSHMIDGGGGADTVVYATTRSVFDVDLIEASGFTVAGESAALVGGHIVVERPDGETDTLIDVERIDFTDGDLIYDIDSPNVEVVYRMYAAALGRTPDETGLRYWVDRLDFLDDLPGSTADSLLQVLADVFIEADEFEMLYGSDPSNADYIDAMYQNVLGRLPDDEGRAFWIDAMERGLERDDILIAFSESAENRDQTGPDLDDGIWVV